MMYPWRLRKSTTVGDVKDPLYIRRWKTYLYWAPLQVEARCGRLGHNEESQRHEK